MHDKICSAKGTSVYHLGAGHSDKPEICSKGPSIAVNNLSGCLFASPSYFCGAQQQQSCLLHYRTTTLTLQMLIVALRYESFGNDEDLLSAVACPGPEPLKVSDFTLQSPEKFFACADAIFPLQSHTNRDAWSIKLGYWHYSCDTLPSSSLYFVIQGGRSVSLGYHCSTSLS